MAYPFVSQSPGKIRNTGLFGLGGHLRSLARRGRRPADDRRAGRLVFDALEPRLLLNGEVLLVDNSHGDAAAHSHDLVVQLATVAQTGERGSPVQEVQVVNRSDSSVVAEAPLASVSSVEVTGGRVADMLQVNGASFAGVKAPAVSFDGGAGLNTLSITGSGAETWQITGANSGHATGQAGVSFANVEALQGGANNNDTFVVTPGGSLSRGIDGGDGGFDSLVYQDTRAQTVQFNSTGPHSGSVVVDGNALAYSGLEPVTVSGSIANVIVNGTGGDDNLVLATAPNNLGALRVSSLNNSLESATFTRPTSSLTVNLMGGNDALTISDFTSTSGASLTVTGGTGTDAVTVAPGTLISTRDTGGANALSSPSVGDSGSVSIAAETISVKAGAVIRADADQGFTSGDVGLTAAAIGNGSSDVNASVLVDGATIRGASLTMTAIAGQAASVTQPTLTLLSFGSTASSEIEGASAIDVGGAVLVSAGSAVRATADATAQPIALLNTDAAIATAKIGSSATADIGGTSRVSAGGVVGVTALNSVNLTVLADGSAGGVSAAGATVAVALANVDTTASISGDASVNKSASASVGAGSTVNVSTTSRATQLGAASNSAGTQQQLMGNNAATADGPVTVAATVAVTHVDQTTKAFIDTDGVVNTGKVLGVDAASSSTVQTLSDASAVQSSQGVGVAVAINVATVTDDAYLDGRTTIASPVVNVAALNAATTDVFRARALSGAGAAGVGVAGALAIDDVSDSGRAYIANGATPTFDGSFLTLTAARGSAATAQAGPGINALGITDGIGASVAINTVSTDAEAAVQQNATVSGLTGLTMTALATRGAQTIATAGAAGGTATAAAVALTIADNSDSAHLDAGSNVKADGSVTLQAGQSTTNFTDATGVANGELTAIGAAIAIGVVVDQTQADSAGTLVAGNAVTLSANGTTNNLVGAIAGPRGASPAGVGANGAIAQQLGFLGVPLPVPDAATADGDLGVAAALAVGSATSTVTATQSAGSIMALGPVSLTADGSVVENTIASGQFLNTALPGTRIGAALAIDLGSETIRTEIDGSVTGKGVSLDTGSGETGSRFGALARSGAGGTNVGVAGALALNVVSTDAEAVIGATGKVDGEGGAVSLSADNDVTDTVIATGVSTGSPVGVGASVAINLVDTTVRAGLDSGASVDDAGQVSIDADADNQAMTTATAGANGGTATAPAVALAYVQDTVGAELKAGASISATGVVDVHAGQNSNTATTASGAAAGANAAIGAVVSLGIVRDTTNADSAGTLTAGGAVSITATGNTNSNTEADASARGAAPSGIKDNPLLGKEMNFLGNPVGGLVPAVQTADGVLGVSAALGVGVTLATVTASQSAGSMTTGGNLLVKSLGTGRATTNASARPVTTKFSGTGIGGAVAVNVGVEEVSATVDSSASAASLTVEALSSNGERGTSNFSATAMSGASNAPVAIAGALAIDVVSTDVEAVIGSQGQVDVHGGAVAVGALGGSNSSALATSQPAPGSAVGIGASVAVNVVFDTSHAALDGGSVANASVLGIVAGSNADALSHAVAGAQAVSAMAGAISVDFVDRHTTAEVTAAPLLSVGSLLIDSAAVGTSLSLADSSIIERSSGLGTVIAVNVALDNSTATLARNVTATGGVSVTAGSRTAAGSIANSGAVGSTSNQSADQDLASLINELNSGPANNDSPAFPNIGTAVANAAHQAGITVPTFGAAAAISANAALGDTEATIANGVTVNAVGAVNVMSTGQNGAVASATSQAINNTATVGLALAADYAHQTIIAGIGANAKIGASTISVTAETNGEVPQIAGAFAASRSAGSAAGAAASIAVNLVANATQASIGSGAALTAQRGIFVLAFGNTEAESLSGAAFNASAAGIGVALAGNLVQDRTEAFIAANATADTPSAIIIDAMGNQTLGAEAQSAGGGGTAIIPASITANLLVATTRAYAAAGSALDEGGGIPLPSQGILIQATDDTTVTGNAGNAGNVGGSKTVGAGASADFGFIQKNTIAHLDGNARVGGDIIVRANSQQQIASQAASNGVSSLIHIAGSGAVQMENITTQAFIGPNAMVRALDSINVTSNDVNAVNALASARNAAVAATAGAGVAAISLTRTVEAYIGAGATVDAEGIGNGTSAFDGEFTITYDPANNGPGEVGRPFLPGALTSIFNIVFNNPIYTIVSTIANSDVSFLDISPLTAIPDNPSVSKTRVATPDSTNISGVAVTALSQDDLETSGTGFGAAFGASPELSASGIITNTATSAFIDKGAKINLDRADAGSAQSVLVAAASDLFALDLAGTIALAGAASVGPGVTLALIQPLTQAYIGANAQVRSSTDVIVKADSTQDVVGVPSGVTAALAATVAGALPVISIESTTLAFLDQNSNVQAPDNILVFANNTTSSEPVSGVLAVSLGVGFGTSAAVSLIANDTEAFIATGAEADAGGFGRATVIALNPDTSPDSPTTSIHGLSVLAMSSELTTDLSVAASPSGGIGIAGTVGAELVGNTTSAHIDDGAKINVTGQANAAQTVDVGAYDDTHTIGAAVNLEGGLVEIGGGVDVGIIRNSTLATIGIGAAVNAARDVDVVARSHERADSFVGGAGISGLVGLNGSVSAVSIGAVVGAKLLDALTSINGPGTVQGYIDKAINGLVTQGNNSLIKVLNNYAQGVGGNQAAASAMAAAAPNAPATTAVTASQVGQGTVAAVVGSKITAGRDVNVKARDKVEAALDTSFTFSFSALNSPLSIAIDAGLYAGRADAAAGIAGHATVTAAHNINVGADADTTQTVQSTLPFNSSADNAIALVDNSTLKAVTGNVAVTANGDTKSAFSGLLPGFSGLKVRFSDANVANTILATVDNHATVTAAGSVDVTATDTDQINIKANGATLSDDGFAGLVVVGGALAINNIANSVTADIDNATVNASTVEVSALDTSDLTSIALGAVVTDDLGIGGGAAHNTVGNSVHAFIGDNAMVTATGAIGVDADDDLTLLSISGGAVALATASIGAAYSYSNVTDTVLAEIDNATVTSTGGKVSVTAETTSSDAALALGLAEADQVSGAGSVTTNTFAMTITAQIDDMAKVRGAAGVGVAATDNSHMQSLAGGVAVSTGALGVGGAIAINNVANTTRALINNATVSSTSGNVTVTATATPELDALTAGAAGAAKVALAGSYSQNMLGSTVEAAILASSTVTAKSIITLASDSPVIKALAGSAAVGISAVSVSGSVGRNTITDKVTAHDENSAITANAVTVKAVSNPRIFAIAAAGAASQTVSVNGAVTINILNSTIAAFIAGGTAVVKAQSVDVEALDEAGSNKSPGIQSIAGGIGIGGQVGVGGSVAANTITDKVHAEIASGAAVAAPSVTVNAVDDPGIEVIAGELNGAGTVAIGASAATNTITDTVTADIDKATITGTKVAVTADSHPSIKSLALTGGASGTVAGLASVTTNTIHSLTDAHVSDGAVLKLGGGALTVSAMDTSDIESLSGSAGGAGTAEAAAALAFNNVDDAKNSPSGVSASISGATFTAGMVSVTATFAADLLGVAISGGGAGTVSFNGSGVSNIVETHVSAEVQNSTLAVAGKLAIVAQDSSSVSGLAGDAQGAGVASGGAAVVVNRIGNTIAAGHDGGIATIGSEGIAAMATGEAKSLAVSGAGAATAAGVFDDTENIIFDTIDAHIGTAAKLTTSGAVTVTATDSMTVMSLAGSAAGASAFAGSGAHAQNDIGQTNASRPSSITASIKGGAQVKAGSIGLKAVFTGTIESLAIGVSGSGAVSGAASIVDSVIKQPVTAEIVDAATKVTSSGSISLQALDSSSITAIAGSAQGSGVVAAGAAITTSSIANTVTADITAATVSTTASGSNIGLLAMSTSDIEVFALAAGGSGIVAAEGAVDSSSIGTTLEAQIAGNATVTARNSVTVGAIDGATIEALATSVAGAGGAALAGAVATNNIGDTTEAFITASKVTAAQGSITVAAAATGSIKSASFGAAGGIAGVSGGVSVNEIGNQILASVDLGATLNAPTKITVSAIDGETIKSLAGQAAGGFVGVGGAVTYNAINDAVRASIQGASKAAAGTGGIAILARANGEIDSIAVGGSGGVVGIAGSVAVSRIGNDVEAFVKSATLYTTNNVTIIADSSDSNDTWGGAAAGGLVGLAGTVAVETVSTSTRAFIDGGTVTALGNGNAASVPVMNATTGARSNQSQNGLIVTAINTESLSIKSLTGAGGFVGLAGNVSVVNVQDFTQAFIGDGSTVNSQAQPGAAVIVRAYQGTTVDMIGGAIAVGVVGGAGAVSVTTIDNTTQAWISDSETAGEGRHPSPSSVTAKYIEITADAVENVSPTVIGAAAGIVGIAGSVSYIDIENTTQAFAQKSKLDAIGGVGAIAITASDNTTIDTAVGGGAGGFVGLAAAVTVNFIGNDTEANVIGASLNATGAITVAATSIANISTPTIAGGVGVAGISAAIAVNTIESQTEANLETTKDGKSALFNQDPGFRPGGQYNVGSGQTVAVLATDTGNIDATEGTLGAGILGAGAAIDVDAVRDHVVVDAAIGTEIQAAGNVKMAASSTRSADTNPLAITAGGIAIGGSISVISLGAPVDAAGAGQFSSSLQGQVDGSLKPSSMGVNQNDGQVAEDTKDTIDFTQPQGVDGQLDPTAKDDAITAVIIEGNKTGNVAIVAGGSITIDATNVYNVQTTTGEAQGGIAGLGLAAAYVSLDDNTAAQVGQQAELIAGGNITISAHDKASQQSVIDVFAGTGAIGSFSGSLADVTLNLSVGATVGTRASLSAGGTVSVLADQTSNIRAEGLNFGFGAVSVGAVITDVTVQGNVGALIGSDVEMGALQDRIGGLTVKATGDNIEDATTEATGGGILFGATVNGATASVTPRITAGLVGGDTVDAVGAVTIAAAASGDATADAEGVAIGGLGSIGASEATATLAPVATAVVGSQVAIDTLGTVTVSAAQSVDGGQHQVVATATASGGSIGISGDGGEATATSSGQAVARILGSTSIDAKGAVAVLASAGNKAIASATGDNIGGLAAFGGMHAEADDDGVASATMDPGITVTALSLTVSAAAADYGNAFTSASGGGLIATNGSAPDGAGSFVNLSPTVTALIGAGDTVTVEGNVRVQAVDLPEGDARGEGTGVGGVDVGTSNATITITPEVMAAINASAKVAAMGTVDVLAQERGLNGTPNGNFNAATAVNTGNSTISFPANTGLETGDQVTYQTNGGTAISGLVNGKTYSVIAASPTTVQLGQSFDAAKVNSDTETITFAVPHDFQNGDRVVYSSNGGPAIGGLVNGGTYFVRVINPFTIKLAATKAQALQPDQVFTAANVNGATSTITLNANGFTNGEAVTYRTTGTAIGGLVNGNTYYVIRIDANHFRLAAAPNGAALALHPAGASGNQEIGFEGADLDASGVNGVQNIVYALTSPGSGTQRLVGVGGLVSSLQGYTVDGVISGVADGSSGSFIGGGDGTEVDITITASVKASIGASANVTAARDVNVGTQFAVQTDQQSGSSAFGLFGSDGSTEAHAAVTLTNLASIGNSATVKAGGDVSVTAAATFVDNGESTSSGGSIFGAGSDATTTVVINQSTQATIGTNAVVNAGDTIAFDATSSYQSQLSATSHGGAGGGAAASSTVLYILGNLLQQKLAPTTVTIGSGTSLNAGHSVNLTADVTKIHATTIGKATAVAGLGSHAGVDSETDILSLAQVTVANNATITAPTAISIQALQTGIATAQSVDAESTALFPSTDGTDGDINLISSIINVGKGAFLTTHNLDLKANVVVQSYPLENGNVDFNFDFNWQRHITFNGTAVILSGPDPELVVNRSGKIVDNTGISVTPQGVVQNIANHGTGTITFETNRLVYQVVQQVPGIVMPSLIDGSQGGVDFVDTFGKVTIANYSPATLTLNGIDPVNRDNNAKVTLIADLTPIDFVVHHSFQPTAISIGNLWSAVSPDLVVAGVINNPIGDTSLVLAGGSLREGAGGLIRSASLEVTAAKAIGAAAGVLAVEMVQSGGISAMLTLKAGGNINVDLGGDQRDLFGFALTITSSITAGGNINLQLEQGLAQLVPSGPAYKVAVVQEAPPNGPQTTTTVINHFHIDSGPPVTLPTGIFGTGSTPVVTDYDYTALTAGGSINITDPGPAISVTATTNLTGNGTVSVNVSGDINITEATGDLTVGTIHSTGGNVTLAATDGSIIDQGPPNGPVHVIGQNISLQAAAGGIGSSANPLLVMLVGGAGMLTANAADGIFISETAGDLRLGAVVSTTSDVALATRNGSILDATSHTKTNVTGNTVSLSAANGSIGTSLDHLTAASYTGPGGIMAMADNGVFLDDPPALHKLGLTSGTRWVYDDASGTFVTQHDGDNAPAALSEAGADWDLDSVPAPLASSALTGATVDWSHAGA